MRNDNDDVAESNENSDDEVNNEYDIVVDKDVDDSFSDEESKMQGHGNTKSRVRSLNVREGNLADNTVPQNWQQKPVQVDENGFAKLTK